MGMREVNRATPTFLGFVLTVAYWTLCSVRPSLLELAVPVLQDAAVSGC
jgi:hypothetical protein